MKLEHWAAALLSAFGPFDMGCSTTTHLQGEVSPETVLAIKWRHEFGPLKAEAQDPRSGQRTQGTLLETDTLHTAIAPSGGPPVLVDNADVRTIRHRKSSAGAGAILGALTGSILAGSIAYVTYTDPCANQSGICLNFFGPAPRVMGAGLLGAAVSALVGTIVGDTLNISHDYVFGVAPGKERL